MGGLLAGGASWMYLHSLSPDLGMEDGLPVMLAAFLLGAVIALWVALQLMPAVPRWGKAHSNSRGDRLPSADDGR